MYTIKIDPELITQLYYRREFLRSKGIKKPITKQIHEAIRDYLDKEKSKISKL